jgi:hypothetical protein
MGQFHFKGDRTYLHGTTIFDFVLADLSKSTPPRDIDFLMHRQTDREIEVIPASELNVDHSKVVGEFLYNSDKLLITETNKKIQQRVPYNETDFLSFWLLTGQKVVESALTPSFSSIERIIGAYKYLLTSLFQAHYGQFLFARIQLRHLPSGKLALEHQRIISKRYFQGIILEEEEVVGAIFFGTKKL